MPQVPREEVQDRLPAEPADDHRRRRRTCAVRASAARLPSAAQDMPLRPGAEQLQPVPLFGGVVPPEPVVLDDPPAPAEPLETVPVVELDVDPPAALDSASLPVPPLLV